MAFREQVTKVNPVGKWMRAYRRKNDLSVVELQLIFDKQVDIGVPVSRVETTDSPMTKVVSTPILEFFDHPQELRKAFSEHNNKALDSKYEL